MFKALRIIHHFFAFPRKCRRSGFSEELFDVLGAQPIAGNTISINTAKQLQKVLLTIPSDDVVENAQILNAKLSELGLPVIDIQSLDFKGKPSSLNGYAGSTVVGGEFTDGTHRYCFPCQVGWNSFRWGIAEIKRPSVGSSSGNSSGRPFAY